MREFKSCYLIVGRDLQFATKIISVLLDKKVKLIAIGGVTAPDLFTWSKTNFQAEIGAPYISANGKPWLDEYFVTKTNGIETLGILGGLEYIIPKDFLTNRFLINMHPSFLPFNKGSHQSFWSIIDETPIGASIHWVNDEIDSGPIIARDNILVGQFPTATEIQKKSLEKCVELLNKNLVKIMSGKINSTKNTGGTIHLKSDIHQASTLQIGETISVSQLFKLVRAVCNKRNGFRIKVGQSTFLVRIDSIEEI